MLNKENSTHVCTQEVEIGGIKAAILEMKDTLKKISELLVGQATNAEKIKDCEEVLKDHEKRIRVVEKESQANTGKVTWMERLIWSCVVAMIGTLAYLLRS